MHSISRSWSKYKTSMRGCLLRSVLSSKRMRPWRPKLSVCRLKSRTLLKRRRTMRNKIKGSTSTSLKSTKRKFSKRSKGQTLSHPTSSRLKRFSIGSCKLSSVMKLITMISKIVSSTIRTCVIWEAKRKQNCSKLISSSMKKWGKL